MKLIPLLIITFVSFYGTSAQTLKYNDVSHKYESVFKLNVSEIKGKDNTFSILEKWLADAYNNRFCGIKLLQPNKGLLIYGGAFETSIFRNKGMISFNFHIKLESGTLIGKVSEFAYTAIENGEVGDAAGFSMSFEDLKYSKDKIIKETENHLMLAIKKLELDLGEI